MFNYLFSKTKTKENIEERIDKLEYDVRQIHIDDLNKRQDEDHNFIYEGGYYYGVHRDFLDNIYYTMRYHRSLSISKKYYPNEIEELKPLLKLYKKYNKTKKK